MGEKYLYVVIESKSPEMPIGKKFWSFEKLHDDRKKNKIVELSDVQCRDYFLKFLKKAKVSGTDKTGNSQKEHESVSD